MLKGFLTLLEREIYRFLRLSKQTLLPPITTTLLFIFIFGYSLGSQIKQIEGFPYIVYILPGLIGMGVLNNAFANTSTSLFMAKMDRSIENILITPISYFQMLFAFLFGGILRGMSIGFLSLIVACMITELQVYSWINTLLIFFLMSLIFSALGLIAGMLADSWDHIATLNNFFITPLVYLGGVFFSISFLPPFWQKLSHFNPIFYLIDAVRLAILGRSFLNSNLVFMITTLLAICSFLMVLILFKKGYKLLS